LLAMLEEFGGDRNADIATRIKRHRQVGFRRQR